MDTRSHRRFRRITPDLVAAIADGLFPPVDVDFVALPSGSIRDRRIHAKRDPLDTQAAADFATALFLNGVRALPHLAAAKRPDPGSGGHQGKAMFKNLLAALGVSAGRRRFYAGLYEPVQEMARATLRSRFPTR